MPKPEGREAGFSASRFDSVVADVDSAEHDLPVSVVDQSPDFVRNIVRRAALQAGSNAGDDAVSAVQNAAILNLHIGSPTSVKVADAARHVDDAHSIEDVGQLTFVRDNLEHRGEILQDFRLASRVAAHHDSPRARVFLRQSTDQLPSF